jgi:hypothetical protein
MARDLEQRYQTVEELAYALERFAGGVTFRLSNTPQGALALTPSVSMRVAKPGGQSTRRVEPEAVPARAAVLPRSRLGLVLAAAGVVAMLALFAVWALRVGRQLPAERVETRGIERPVKPAQPAVVAAPAPARTAAPAIAAPAPAAQVEVVAAPAPEARPEQPAAKSASRRKPRTQPRVPAPEQANTPAAAPARTPSLPSDWDERLIESPARAKPRSAADKAAGRLSSDDL